MDKLEAIKKFLSKVTDYYEYNYYTIVGNKVLYSTYPEQWVKYYTENKYDQIDWVQVTAQKYALPFSWGDSNKSEITQEQKKIFVEAQHFGIKAGVTIPLLKDSSVKIFLSSNNSQNDVEKAFNYLAKDLLAIQCLLSNEILIKDEQMMAAYSELFFNSHYNQLTRTAQRYETLNALAIFVNQAKLPPRSKMIAEEFIEDLKSGLR